MADKQRLYLLVLIGGAILAWLAFRQYENTDQPRYQYRNFDVIGNMDFSYLAEGGMGEQFCHPDQHSGPVTYLPCRFPVASGGNVAAIINHGFDSLFNAKPQQADWMYSPPSEVQGL